MTTRYIKAFTLVLLVSVRAYSQSISFTDAEKVRLKTMISSDTSAGRIFSEIRKKADQSLKDAPNPVSRLSTSGRLKGDPVREESLKSIKDLDKIWSLSVSYIVTDDKKYLDKDIQFLTSWAATNKASGEPINETKLLPLLEGYDMVRKYMNENDRRLVDTWLDSVANAEMLGEKMGLRNSYNNVRSHRIMLVGIIGYLLNNGTYKSYAESAIKDQIANNLYADGTSFDLTERDALHYHCYTLNPLLRLSMVFRRNGKDFFDYVSPANTSIKKSVSYLLPYVTGEKTHEEYVHSRISFDKKRSDAGMANHQVGQQFNPELAVATISLAEYFEPSYSTYIASFYKGYGKFPSWQLLYNYCITEQN